MTNDGGIGCEAIGQHLQRDIAREPPVARAVDLAHASDTDLFGDLIRAKARTLDEAHLRDSTRLVVSNGEVVTDVAFWP